MKKLNNKGMTIIEILVCFLLVSFISTALFTTVSSFNNKRNIESVKADLLQYRNDIDKMIEDDLIHYGLINAEINEGNPETTVTLHFKDGTSKLLVIYSRRAGEYSSDKNEVGTCTGFNDEFYIGYGTSKTASDYVKYTLPDVGSFTNDLCDVPEVIKDLRFNTINVSNEDNVLFIYINFYHPELGNDYSINIIAPINYFV